MESISWNILQIDCPGQSFSIIEVNGVSVGILLLGRKVEPYLPNLLSSQTQKDKYELINLMTVDIIR